MNSHARPSRNAPPTRSLLAPETDWGPLTAAVTALSEGQAAAAWGNVVTRLRFHVTVPGDRGTALDLRDELTGWLQQRGLNLGLTDNGTDTYLTWPSPRVCPDIPPLSPGPVVFPPRTPGGPSVYAKPTITKFGCEGAVIAEAGPVTIRYAYTDNDTGTLGLYEGRIDQGDLFRLLLESGLITRRDEGK